MKVRASSEQISGAHSHLQGSPLHFHRQQPILHADASHDMFDKSDPYDTPIQRRVNAVLIILTIAILVLLARSSAHAQTTFYWDQNGTTAGAGSTPSGTWSTSNGNQVWNDRPDGAGTQSNLVSWTNAATPNNAVFSAGTDAVNPYTVTVSGAISVGLITFEEGTVTLAGTATAALTIHGGITVQSTVTGPISLQNTLPVTLGASQTWTNNSAQLLSVAGNLTSAQTSGTTTLALAGGTGGINIGGNISNGTGTNQVGLTVSGGTVTLGGANSYSGNTAVQNGTLILNGSNSSSGTTQVNSTGTLALGTGVNGGLASGLLSLSGTLRSTDSTSRTISNNVSLTGNATFGAATGGTGALTINGTVDLGVGAGVQRTVTTVSNTTFANAVTGNSGSGLIKNGGGTLTFSGSAANTYTGTTTVNVGQLDLDKTAGVNAIAGDLVIGDGTGTDAVRLLASNQIADTSNVTINGSGVLNLNNNSESIRSLSGVSGAQVQLGSGTFTISPTSGSTTFAGVISGTGGNLVKSGAGTQILSGNNTYTGTTAISGGQLEINNTGSTSSGRISGTSGVTVNSGGTLLLSGNTSFTDRINDNASVTLNGGTLNLNGMSEINGAPSATSAGVGALTLTSTSTIDFGANSLAQAIMFAGVGGHTAGSILQITNWNGLIAGGGSDRILFAGNADSFRTSYAQNEVSFNGLSGYNLVEFDGFYELTVVPEPGTWAAGILAVGAIAWTQRRRFRQKPLLAPELPVA